MGAVRNGDIASAKKEIVQLQSVNQGLLEAKDDYWAEQTDIQIAAVSAWVAHAQGKKTEAVKLMRHKSGDPGDEDGSKW